MSALSTVPKPARPPPASERAAASLEGPAASEHPDPPVDRALVGSLPQNEALTDGPEDRELGGRACVQQVVGVALERAREHDVEGGREKGERGSYRDDDSE